MEKRRSLLRILDSSYCMRSVQIRSFFWSVFSRIRTEYGEILRGLFSPIGHFPTNHNTILVILAGLFLIMLFTLLKKIINVLKFSRLHCPAGFMVSIAITSKITSLLNLSKTRRPNVSS